MNQSAFIKGRLMHDNSQFIQASVRLLHAQSAKPPPQGGYRSRISLSGEAVSLGNIGAYGLSV
jgi:hypothetical protein